MTDEQAARNVFDDWHDNKAGTELPRLDQVSLVAAIAAALAARERAVWLEAVKLTCPMCAKGYPLQKNGGWHNDMNGKDTVVNAMCDGAEFRHQAYEVKR